MPLLKKKNKNKQLRHKRIIQTWTAPVEKRILAWLAARTPRQITPDHLTVLGLFAAVLISISYILSKTYPVFLWIACAGLFLNWYGDSLDGTLARFRKIERPRYGYFLDHSIDAICITIIMVGLGFSGYVRMEIALVGVIGYLLLTLYTTLANFTSHEFKISYAHLGPTEIRILTMIASIWVFYDGSRFIHLPFGNFTFYEALLFVLILLLYGAFLYSTVIQIIRLAKAEPPQPY